MSRNNRIRSMLIRFDRMSDEQLAQLPPRLIDDYRRALIASFEASVSGLCPTVQRLSSGRPARAFVSRGRQLTTSIMLMP